MTPPPLHHLLPASPIVLRNLLWGQRASSSFGPANLRMAETGGSPFLPQQMQSCWSSPPARLRFFLINAHDKWVWKGGQPAPGILHFSRGNRRSWIHETIMHHLNIFPSNWILQKGGWPGPSFLLIRGGGLTLHPSADGVVPQPPGGARGGSVCLAYQRVS